MKIIQTKDRRVIALRIVLLILSFCAVTFIFSNSLKEASVSTEQSSQVVDAIQEVVEVIAPQSPIATAKGEEYDKLHKIVRKLAHFSEFALVGALFCWTYLSFFKEKKGAYLPALGVVAVACVDECIQLFSKGRGASILDVLLDSLGGAFGVAFACLLVWIIQIIIAKKRVK